MAREKIENIYYLDTQAFYLKQEQSLELDKTWLPELIKLLNTLPSEDLVYTKLISISDL